MARSPYELETLAPNALVPGTDYRVIRPLGSGGFGKVYEVEHDRLRTRYALKVVNRDLAHRKDVAWRLLEEARELGRFIDHDHLVKVIDANTTRDGRVFYVMELLPGGSLRDELRRREAAREAPRADLVPWALGVVLQVLAAIDAAHARDLMHRDLKPDNIFLTRNGPVKLLDFGVAKCINDAAPPRPYETEPGDFVGTLMYAPPECLDGKPFDPRSDLYSLGVVLWETLVGVHPFHGLQRLQTMTNISIGVPPLESKLPGVFSPALCALVRRATALDPAKRFPSAKAFAEAIVEVLTLGLPASETLALPAPREPSLSAFLRAAGVGTRVAFVNSSTPPAVASGASVAPARPSSGERDEDAPSTGNPTTRSTPGAPRPLWARAAAWAGRRRRLAVTPLAVLGVVSGALALGVAGTFALTRVAGNDGPRALASAAALTPTSERGSAQAPPAKLGPAQARRDEPAAPGAPPLAAPIVSPPSTVAAATSPIASPPSAVAASPIVSPPPPSAAAVSGAPPVAAPAVAGPITTPPGAAPAVAAAPRAAPPVVASAAPPIAASVAPLASPSAAAELAAGSRAVAGKSAGVAPPMRPKPAKVPVAGKVPPALHRPRHNVKLEL